MLREQPCGAGAGGGQGLGDGIGFRHGHHVEPDPLDRHPQDAGEAGGLAGIAALGHQAGADLLHRRVVGLVLLAAAFLIHRAALCLAPEGAPGGQAVGRTDRGREIGLDQRGKLLGGRRPGGGKGGLPVLAVFLGHGRQGVGEQPFLGLEMEQHQPVRQARRTRHLGQRGTGKAAGGQRANRRLDDLGAAGLAAHGPGRARRRLGSGIDGGGVDWGGTGQFGGSFPWRWGVRQRFRRFFSNLS